MIDLPIRRSAPENMLRIVSPDGQRAVTQYEAVCSGELYGHCVTLLRLRLVTGRTHQIRVHCAYLGMPLLGDVLYKTATSEKLSLRLGIGAQALHAGRLGFTEPLTGERVDITAPLRREDMTKILTALGTEDMIYRLI